MRDTICHHTRSGRCGEKVQGVGSVAYCVNRCQPKITWGIPQQAYALLISPLECYYTIMSTNLVEPEEKIKSRSRSEAKGQRKRERLIYMALIGAGVIASLFFGLRFLHMVPAMRGLRPGPPPVGSAAIEPWMTVGHVARITHVPEGYLWQTLDISPLGNRRHSLEKLQEIREKDNPDALPILPLLHQAVDDFQTDHPPGGSPP